MMTSLQWSYSQMKFKPETLGFRVILKPFIETMSKGGIAIARDERSQAINTDKGEVFMIGREAWGNLAHKPELQAGDKVYYAKYSAKVLKDEVTGEYYILCNDEDILVGYENE
jgi:co-chaperonin GroES (HSP10)